MKKLFLALFALLTISSVINARYYYGDCNRCHRGYYDGYYGSEVISSSPYTLVYND